MVVNHGTEKPSIGSCFTIDLPFNTSVDGSNTKPIVVPLESNLVFNTGQKYLILLAEDNEANISTFSSYFKAFGYQLEIAKNWREAIDLTISYKPNIILMDIQMPGIKQISSNSNLVDMPIIVLKALAMPGDRERYLEVKTNEYLAKPLKMSNLLSTIKQLLSIKT
jgi:CheY-like chemotaxis protein